MLPGMTFAGNETNMALWTQVATGSGTGAGAQTMPTHVTLSNPFVLNAGTLYGIAVVADPQLRSTTPTAMDRIKTIPTRTWPFSSDPPPTCRSPRRSSLLGYGMGRSITLAVRAAAVQRQRQHLPRRAAARQVRSTCSSPIPIRRSRASCRSQILAEPGVVACRPLRCASRHSHPGTIAAV